MTQAADTQPLTLAALASPGLRAVRRFWRAFVLIQSCALLLVLTYFHSAAIQHACETLTNLQHRGGLLLSAITAAIAGAIVPEIAKIIAPPKSKSGETGGGRLSNGDVAFAVVAFAINGLIIDLQYRMFAWLIGSDDHFSTAVKKMVVDQFGTTPIYGIVYFAVIYRWKAHRFRIGPLMRELGPRWYLKHVGPLLIPCWCFWVPMVLMIYSMPRPLQFSLYCLALAAWSLVMLFIANDTAI